MPLTVMTYVAYRTRHLSGVQSEYDAHKFIQAIKGRTVKGYAWIPVAAVKRKLEQSNRDRAAVWFGELAAAEILARVPEPRVLIPIPNSDCVVGAAESRTGKLVHEIARHITATIWDGLRWVEPNIPSSQGGPRDPEVLLANLRIVRRPATGSCVLVDDVTTSGGHFKAAAAKLRSRGMMVALAIAAGQTVHEPVDNPFGWVAVTLDDFEPG
jgi:predicted amidophosphoribosyltransferase